MCHPWPVFRCGCLDGGNSSYGRSPIGACNLGVVTRGDHPTYCTQHRVTRPFEDCPSKTTKTGKAAIKRRK